MKCISWDIPTWNALVCTHFLIIITCLCRSIAIGYNWIHICLCINEHFGFNLVQDISLTQHDRKLCTEYDTCIIKLNGKWHMFNILKAAVRFIWLCFIVK